MIRTNRSAVGSATLGVFLTICGLALGWAAWGRPDVAMRANAAQLWGGDGDVQMGCYKLATTQCEPPPAGDCTATPCTSGVFSWYCPAGSVEWSQENTSRPVCAGAWSGAAACNWYGDNPTYIYCSTSRACGNPCVVSTVTGINYCSGPTGPVISWDRYYVPFLVGVCTDRDDV